MKCLNSGHSRCPLCRKEIDLKTEKVIKHTFKEFSLDEIKGIRSEDLKIVGYRKSGNREIYKVRDLALGIEKTLIFRGGTKVSSEEVFRKYSLF